MKGLILAALVGFVLAFTLALPFTEDEIKAYNTELKDIGNDITQSNLESHDDDDEVDSDDDNEEDEDNEDEDEDDGNDDYDEDDGDDDDDEDQVDEGESSLSNPVQQSSDPAIGILPFVRVFRAGRRLVRRFRRRRRGSRTRRRRVGRWFRRRRGRRG